MDFNYIRDLGIQVDAMRDRIEAQKRHKTADLQFARQTLDAMEQVAIIYADQLRQHEITAQIGAADDALTFGLRWPDRVAHRLELRVDTTSGHLRLTRLSPDETTGVSHKATGTPTYTERNWSESVYEIALQDLINSYISEAEKHGGIA